MTTQECVEKSLQEIKRRFDGAQSRYFAAVALLHRGDATARAAMIAAHEEMAGVRVEIQALVDSGAIR